MRSFNQRLSAIFVAGLLFFSFAFQANAQDQREVSDILNKLNGKITDFQYNFNSDVNNNSVSQSEEQQTTDLMRDVRSDLEDFQDNLNNRRASADDVRQVLASARSLNDYLLRLRLNAKTLNDWKNVRNLFDQLAGKYNVSTSWNLSSSRQTNVNYAPNNLTGTYQLDTSRSDNVQEIVDEAINNGNVQNRDEAKQDLEQNLESPQNLAIDVRGNQVVLASTLTQQITLSADGQDRNQTLPDGSTMRLRTTLRGQELTISRLGNNNDYTVTFSSTDNGRSLKVTRRMTTDYLSQTVFAESFYTKTDSVARLDISDNQNNSSTNTTTSGNYPTNTGGNNPTTTTTNYPPTTRTAQTGQFIVPNGEMITGTLESNISTKVSQNNDRFRMRVTAPNQYRGAIIEGYVSGIDRSSRNPIGKAKITFNFETIRLANGQTYDFAGFLQSVTDANGRSVKVDEEGSASKTQTKETAKRAGIGAGAGAILGAIIGGAKGAVIGATIGAGGGAGTVAIENKGDLELNAGSSITVQSSAPTK